MTLDQNDSRTKRSWFVIDELSDTGRLPGLSALAKKSRSKGGAICVSFQSVESLRSQESFGPHATADLLGQIATRFIGRLECPESARYASSQVGDQEIRQITVSRSYSREESTTYNESIVIKPAILPSEFATLPPCSLENGLTAYYPCRSLNSVVFNNLPGRDLFERDLIPLADDVPGFLPRPSESQYLREWTPEEEAVFAPKPPSKGGTGRRSKPPEGGISDFLDGMNDL